MFAIFYIINIIVYGQNMDNSMEFVSDPHNAVISEETVVEVSLI